MQKAINKKASEILSTKPVWKMLVKMNGRKWAISAGRKIAFEATRLALNSGMSEADALSYAISECERMADLYPSKRRRRQRDIAAKTAHVPRSGPRTPEHTNPPEKIAPAPDLPP